MKRFGWWLAAALCAAGIYQSQCFLDARRADKATSEETLYFSDPAVLRRLCFGFSSLAADFYWLRAIQYYGGKDRSRSDLRYDLLEPLLEIVTSLDQRMIMVYRFGAIFLSEPKPIGAGDVPAALRLLEKGVERNPEAWELLFDKGFVFFWQKKDYNQAAEWFFRASRHPKAPLEIDSLARSALGRQGDMETAERLWEHQYVAAPSERLKQNARRNLDNLDYFKRLWTLEWLIELFWRQENRFPVSWEELRQRGWLKEIPKDVYGDLFSYRARDGKISCSADTAAKLSPLPEIYRKNYFSQLERQRQEALNTPKK